MPSTRKAILRAFLLAALAIGVWAQERPAPAVAPMGPLSPVPQQPPAGKNKDKLRDGTTGNPPSIVWPVTPTIV